MWLLVAHVSRLVSAKKTGIWASVYIKVPRSDFAHSFSNINDSNQCNACLRLISEKLRESSTILILRKIDFLKILLTKFLQISSNDFFSMFNCWKCAVSSTFLSDPSQIIGYACHSLTHPLTHWLTDCRLVNLIDVTLAWRWQLKTCSYCLAMLVTHWLTHSLTHWLV